MGSDGSITSGILRGIEDGWFMSEIAEAAFTYQTGPGEGREEDRRRQRAHQDRRGALEILRVSHEVEREQKRVLAQRRAARDDAAVQAALARMVEAARGDANMVPAMLDAARAEATLGEICDALRAEWGDYREPPRF